MSLVYNEMHLRQIVVSTSGFRIYNYNVVQAIRQLKFFQSGLSNEVYLKATERRKAKFGDSVRPRSVKQMRFQP